MLDAKKRNATYSADYWTSKRRKMSTCSSSQESQSLPPPPARSVVALLALTDPTILTRITHFIPMASDRTRGELTHVMKTLVSLCRAVAPFDRALPRNFGPQNQVFWQNMVLRYFDFSTRGAASQSTTITPECSPHPTLAVWNRLGVSFVPTEYGFLQKIQSAQASRTVWSRNENAFTLFCDLALLVDKLRGASSNKTRPWFVPCLRRPGAIEPRPGHLTTTVTIPFVSRVRRSRREQFAQVVTTQLRGWKHFRAHGGDGTRDCGRIDFYAGQSCFSNRWIGLTSVCGPPSTGDRVDNVKK